MHHARCAISLLIGSSRPRPHLQGMDCLSQFKLFQECLQRHPEHVDQLMQDAEEEEEEGSVTAAAAGSEPAAPQRQQPEQRPPAAKGSPAGPS